MNLTPSDSIANQVANSPVGTTFNFSPGVYRNVTITPKNYQKFIGSPGAIFTGAQPLTFTKSGNYWVSQCSAAGTLGGFPSDSPQQHPEDLFVDNVPLVHVGTLAEVVPGKWFFDYQLQTVYMIDDPTNHSVEISVTRSAFNPWNQMPIGVEIRDLQITKYAVPAAVGAIGDQYPSCDWLIENCEINLNHGVGISLNSKSIVKDCFIHDNGHMGIMGGGGGIEIDGCYISGNNFANFDTGWAAGGIKLAQAHKALITRCLVRKNNGAGIWFDVDSIGCDTIKNIVEDNLTGISYEVSWGGHCYKNICVRNPDGAIINSTTVNLLVEENKIDMPVSVFNYNLSQAIYGWHSNAGLQLKNNWVNGVLQK